MLSKYNFRESQFCRCQRLAAILLTIVVLAQALALAQSPQPLAHALLDSGSIMKPTITRPAVIAYYTGHHTNIESYDLNKITHLIYGFCGLKGNKLALKNPADSVAIRKLVKLKGVYPHLKVLVALGGWGGCKTCSEVFAIDHHRKAFANSTLDFLNHYHLDGLDLDWEYPAIPGFPGHSWSVHDRDNFTLLLRELRNKFLNNKELSFAAGVYELSLQKSIDWVNAALYADRIHLMTYDLRSSRHDSTGHHAPLYPTPQQHESADYAVKYLMKLGIASNKLVIGAAFYGRVFSLRSNDDAVLFRPGKFKRFIVYRKLKPLLDKEGGFRSYYDEVAQAPFAWSKVAKEFVTYDNFRSVRAKAEYVLKMNLAGLMFWELSQDFPRSGFLDNIHEALNRHHELSEPKTR